MADNKIKLEVDLQANLGKVTNATNSLKLNQQQIERSQKYARGAQLALDSNDLRTFRGNFNSLIKLFKEAASTTGKLSDEIKKMTERQTLLNQEINRLKDKKTDLESSLTKDRKRITASAAQRFASSNADAKKVLDTNGLQVSRNRIIELQKALETFLKTENKKLAQITNEEAQNLGFQNRTSAFAANKYVNAESKEQTRIQTNLVETESEINEKESEYTKLSDELIRMSSSATSGAEAINKLYTEISKIGDETNKTVNETLNERRLEEADRREATPRGPDIDSVQKQSSSLGKAFKQFTLYAVAVRAAKTALREAVQTVKELDKYLTEQAMVTGMTREQTYGLVKEYQNLALQVGATTKEIASVATEYMKQGKTIQDSLTLTQAAVSAAKVARVSVGDSVNYLTTALNGFMLSAEEAMKVSDKFAAVAAASATDYDELAIALSKVASQANLAGMSIDYTTALLTKGLETTREAPETMGTALKTIIARMRELSDYGETLEGDTDINNVESQLAYVGIALRDANGDLRSTEDVLDELGKKWDTLNKNQQAALAKALAGTRQQSRLIAMMDDYERVIELQEISQRSAGATAAQAGTYLEGIEAAMNKIQVAWEKVIMTVTDSQAIIGIFEWIGTTLDHLGDFLSTDFGMASALITMSTIGATILSQKIQQYKIQQLSYRLTLQEKEAELKKIKTEKENARIQAKQVIDQQKEAISAKEEQITKLKTALIDEKDLSKRAELTTQLTAAEGELTEQQETLKKAQIDYAAAKRDELTTNIQISENLSEQRSTMGIIGGLWNTIISPITTVISLAQTIKALYWSSVAAKKAENAEEKKGIALKGLAAVKAKIKAGWDMASSAGAIPIIGFGIGLAILAAIGISLAVNTSRQKAYNKSAEGTAETVNKLSNEIYKLNEKANAVNKIASSFDELDNKLIKSNEDLKEMNSLLDQAADKLSDEERETYEGLGSDKKKREYLDIIEENARNEANNLRRDQIDKMKRMNSTELNKFLSEDATDAEIIKAQDSIFALNNNTLYEHIDLLKENKKLSNETASALQNLTQRVLEEMTAEEAWAYAKENNGESIKALIDKIRNLSVTVKDTKGDLKYLNVAEVLTSDDYSLSEQVQAYETTLASLKELGDQNALEAFENSFKQFEFFSKSNFDNTILNFIDKVELTNKDINKLYESWESLNKAGIEISQQVFQNRFKQYLNVLAATQGDVISAAKTVYGDFIQNQEDLNAFIVAYGDLVEVGILNMGQNMDKFKNSVTNFYEKAAEWNTMSESDKATFISDNAALFSQFDSEDDENNLLQAFESGDFAKIETALRNNKALQDQLSRMQFQVEQELAIERAKTGSEQNKAYIAQLEGYEKYLNDVENLFKASLEIRLEQEQKQLDEYRSYLEDQQKALEDSLNKRKEAYEKYFESVNQQEEDEEYEEQADLLVRNLSKLGSSTNASAIQQTKELEQQLEELEKDRLKELRERAQEAVLEQMDDTLEEINNKFDKLLDSNQALLAAMKGELDNPVDFMTNLIGNKIESGATALEMQDFVQSLQGTYGSVLGNNVDWDQFKIHEENNQLFLTVNGKEIALDTNNEQNLYMAIMKALREIGLR